MLFFFLLDISQTESPIWMCGSTSTRKPLPCATVCFLSFQCFEKSTRKACSNSTQ